MSSDKKRLNLSFSMRSPIQRQAWRMLMDIPAGERTGAVCRMICEHKNQRELLEAVRQAIRQELQGSQIQIKRRRRPGASTRMFSAFLRRCRKEMIQTDPIL